MAYVHYIDLTTKEIIHSYNYDGIWFLKALLLPQKWDEHTKDNNKNDFHNDRTVHNGSAFRGVSAIVVYLLKLMAINVATCGNIDHTIFSTIILAFNYLSCS